MQQGSLSGILARHVATTTLDDIPEPALRAAERSLLDAVGVSIAATGLDPVSRSVAELALREGGLGESSVFGGGRRIPAAAAAFANGAYAHALDFEDAVDGLPIHPNAQIVPAVLAVAEARDLGGDDVVRALAVGCDLGVRIAAAAGTAIEAGGWYPPPILGALGAVGALASLVGLDERRTLDALSLALMQVTASGEAGLSPQSTIRGIRDGFASHAAVRSLQLAEAGIHGFDDPLGGRKGFLATYAGGRADTSALLDGLGERFRGAEVAFKPWPSCRATHAFVDSVLRLREEVALDDIASVTVWGAPFVRTLAEPRASKVAPTVPIDARFSAPFTVAAALVDRAVTLDTYLPASLHRADLRAWAERVEVGVSDDFAGDGDFSGGRTEVRLRDGSVLTDVVLSPRGNPDAPLDDRELVAKFVDCVRKGDPALDDTTARAAAAEFLDFRGVGSVRAAMTRLLGVRADDREESASSWIPSP